MLQQRWKYSLAAGMTDSQAQFCQSLTLPQRGIWHCTLYIWLTTPPDSASMGQIRYMQMIPFESPHNVTLWKDYCAYSAIRSFACECVPREFLQDGQASSKYGTAMDGRMGRGLYASWLATVPFFH